jgi:alpha-1,2-mannosyltransferase
VELWNLNPPWLTLLFAPLAGLPVHVAVLIWWGFSALCLIGVAWLIVDELRPNWSRPVWLTLIACAASATPTLSLTFTGHLTGPVGLLLTWVWREMRHDRIARAASGIGVAIGIRMFFLPLLGYLVVTKQWRAVGVALLSLTACAVVSLGVFGWSEHLAWIAAMRDVQWQVSPLNASITGMVSRFALSVHGTATAAMPRATWIGLGFSAIFGVFGFWRACVSSAPFDTRWLLLLATSLIAFPVGWIYYFWILAGPLAASWAVPSVRRAIYLTLPAWFLPWSALRITPWVPVTAIVGSIYCWGLLAIWVATVTDVRREVGKS